MLARQFDLCGVTDDEVVLVLVDDTTPATLVETARLALHRQGTRPSVLRVPARPAPSRRLLLEDDVVAAAVGAADFVADCTGHGVADLDGLDDVLEQGTRILSVGDREPADLAHLVPHAGLGRRVERAIDRLAETDELVVTSDDGTELIVTLADAELVGRTGAVTEPGEIDHWPSGSVAVVPASETVRGRLVLMPGDVLVTLGTFVRSPITLEIDNDHVCDIEGDTADSDLLRSHLESFASTDAYGVGSVGWGMNLTSRVHAPGRFDPTHLRPGEADLYAGNVVVTLGSNPVAGRFTEGRTVLCVRGHTAQLDDAPVIRRGALLGELAPDVYELAARL